MTQSPITFRLDQIERPQAPAPSPAAPLVFRAEDIDTDDDLPEVSPDGVVKSSNAIDEQGRSVVTPGEDRDWTDSLVDFAKGVWKNTNPVAAVQAVGEAVTSPIETAKGIVSTQDHVRQEALQAFEAGDYVTGSRKLINWLIPLVGPALDASADKMSEGKYAEGLGEATGIGLGLTAPTALRHTSIKVPGVKAPNPEEAAAVKFGLEEGIPVDAGTATGNRFVKGAQRLNDESALGSIVADRAVQSQADALTRTGAKLADRAKATPVTAEQAGSSIRKAVEASASRLNEAASNAYDKLRALESRAQSETKTVGFDPKSGATTTEPIKLAVNVGAVKDQLLPLYKDLLRERELSGQLMGGKAQTIKALDSLMQGPEWAPLSAVDAALGDLKAMARTKGIPALRTPGQATASQAVAALEKEVQAAAARGGPDVMRALSEGRAFTKQKYAVAELLDDLTSGTGGEPVRVVSKLTANQDAAIAKLKALEKVAPQELPNLGRVVIDELLERATKEGGFTKTQGILADWQKLGAETKSLLFGKPEYIRDLDSFFLLAKKLGENPNPSGTALTLTKSGELGLLYTTGGMSAPISIGSGIVSKLLHSPTVVKALVRGMQIPVGNKGAATAAATNIVNAAKEAGVSLAPAATDQAQPRPARDASPGPPAPARTTSGVPRP
jgi:hypothetical protein